MSHWSYKSIPDAKFEAEEGNGTSHQIRLFTPEKRV